MRSRSVFQLFLSVCAFLALLPAASWAETSVIRAAHMLDVQSGRIVSPAAIVVEDGYIRAVNPPSLPADAQVIDLGGMTLLPGLIDMHVHLTMELTPDYRYEPVMRNSADAALHGAANARKILLAGFTTVRDLAQLSPGKELVTVAMARASDQGLIEAPRIVACGHALSITGGHIDLSMMGPFAEGILDLGPESGVADGIDEVLKATRYQIKYGAKVIKIAATAGVMSQEASAGAQQYSYEEMKAIVDEAARHGIPVAAHAHGTEGIKAAIQAGVASIEHGSLLDDEAIRMMIEHGTYLVPTTHLVDEIRLDMLPPVVRAKAEKLLPLAKENLRKAINGGVKIAFGTDVPMFPHGLNAREFASLVDRGMTPIGAIRSATVNAADLLRVDDRGVLAAGKLADIIAVDGNPLENIMTLEEVRFVMKGGRVYRSAASK